ncbi:unnamed protein product [Closterium sp. Naga37s-1]|nr:unnamed protein product [Closterium sp. Naga37s-1]
MRTTSTSQCAVPCPPSFWAARSLLAVAFPLLNADAASGGAAGTGGTCLQPTTLCFFSSPTPLPTIQTRHAQGTNTSIGIDIDTGALTDMKELGVSGGEWWGVVREIVGEVCVAPYAVKVQTVKTVIEAACMLLGIDDIVSGLKKKQAGGMCVVWEPYAVKVRTVKTAIEAACMLLRIDDVVSGLKKKQAGGAPGGGKPQLDTGDDVDSEQMLAE